MTKFGDVLTTDDIPTGGTTILNGTGPPADALGAVGNYYLDTVAKILYGPKSASPVYGTDQVPITTTPASSTGAVSGSVGSRFKALAAGRITALRYYRYGGAAAYTVTMILYLQSTQVELGRCVISNASSAPGGWVVGTLATPVVVSPNADYRVAFTPSPPVTLSASAGVVPTSSIPSLVSITGNCYTGSANSYPGTDDNSVCYFADIVFQAYGQWPVALKSAP